MNSFLEVNIFFMFFKYIMIIEILFSVLIKMQRIKSIELYKF